MNWQLWTAVLLLAWIGAANQVEAAKKRKTEVIQIWQPQELKPSYASRQLDYPIYVPRVSGGYRRGQGRRVRAKAASTVTTTTQRPIVRVWNSFVRSVQPNFGFRNLTNPLTNLFNNGNANIIETVPLQAIYNDQKEQEQQQELEQDDSEATTQSPSKRKRKRRKQQKRRPVYDSAEQDDDPYGYYGGSSLPIALPHQQPMYYYPNLENYYDLRRLQAYNDYAQHASYYDPSYYEESPVEDEQPQYESEENVRKLNGKKYAILRPLALAIKVPNNDASVAAIDEVLDDDRLATNDEDAANEADVVATEGASDDSASTLSESMRNAIGTYMRDDQRNRERQRQAEKVEAQGIAKIRPRNRHSVPIAERLVNASNKRQ
ncbi:uncharacterized protein LOC127565944 [Drosophila albomicans]|uniref:Uncharacterized protein LOC127565944 n=1 Tax=Drosophila albomicans TaxID=7291 RepID=A0A9C6T1H5_DROAB|nr:uncharacterized protein LOC127565944 [Drosophila albomicans]